MAPGPKMPIPLELTDSGTLMWVLASIATQSDFEPQPFQWDSMRFLVVL